MKFVSQRQNMTLKVSPHILKKQYLIRARKVLESYEGTSMGEHNNRVLGGRSLLLLKNWFPSSSQIKTQN